MRSNIFAVLCFFAVHAEAEAQSIKQTSVVHDGKYLIVKGEWSVDEGKGQQFAKINVFWWEDGKKKDLEQYAEPDINFAKMTFEVKIEVSETAKYRVQSVLYYIADEAIEYSLESDEAGPV